MMVAPPPRLPAVARVATDLAALAVVGMGVAHALPFLPVGDAPMAGLLNGPDAGEWALNAQMVFDGDFGSVDPHRMPTFLLLLSAMLGVEPDIARAGHQISVMAWVLQAAAVYALGRMGGGRAVGLAAGLLVVGCSPLLHGAARFSVDPVLSMMLVLALASVGPVRWAWPWAAVAGAVGAFATVTHLTALPVMIPSLLLVMLRGVRPGAPRWALPAAGLLYVASGLAVLGLVDHYFGLIDVGRLVGAVSEGISASNEPIQASHSLTDAALWVLVSNITGALGGATRAGLAPFYWPGVPWVALLVVCGMGVLGLWLGPDTPAAGGTATAPRLPPWLRRRLRARTRRRAETAIRNWWMRRAASPIRRAALRVGRHTDLRHGIPLLLFLAPLPMFAAAVAEPRYSANLLPVVAVLVARGLVGPLCGIAGRPSSKPASSLSSVRQWVAIALGGLGLVWLADLSRQAQNIGITRMPRADPVAESAVELAAAINAHVRQPGAIATPLREAAAHLGRPYCPRAGCTQPQTPDGIRACIAVLRLECEGDGPVPLVWFERGPLGMGDDEMSQAVGAWAAERYPVLERLSTKAFDAVLIAIPRQEPKDLPAGLAAPTVQPAESYPPPPPTAPVSPGPQP